MTTALQFTINVELSFVFISQEIKTFEPDLNLLHNIDTSQIEDLIHKEVTEKSSFLGDLDSVIRDLPKMLMSNQNVELTTIEITQEVFNMVHFNDVL